MKELIGDALRNAAMRFGAALDLWHKGGDLYSQDPLDELPESKYQIPHGQFAGMYLHEFGKKELIKYLKQIQAIKNPKPEVLENIAIILKYLKEFKIS